MLLVGGGVDDGQERPMSILASAGRSVSFWCLSDVQA